MRLLPRHVLPQALKADCVSSPVPVYSSALKADPYGRLLLMQLNKTPGAVPAYIPWIHGQTQAKTFVCDVMLEGLARQMRLFGIDATSTPQLKKHQRAQGIRCALLKLPAVIQGLRRPPCRVAWWSMGDFAKDMVTSQQDGVLAYGVAGVWSCRNMLQAGLTEQRVVLTGDRVVPRATNSQHVYLVKAGNKKDQLKEIVKVFDIDLATADIMSRCNECAGVVVNSCLCMSASHLSKYDLFAQ